MFPATTIFVFEDKVVSHDNKVTVFIAMRHLGRHRISEDIDVTEWLSFAVFRLMRLVVEKAKELKGLYNTLKCFFNARFVVIQVVYVHSVQELINQNLVIFFSALTEGLDEVSVPVNQKVRFARDLGKA